jgi:GrpB-like predicted nucleotidyltransferase (UPF0157 family)
MERQGIWVFENDKYANKRKNGFYHFGFCHFTICDAATLLIRCQVLSAFTQKYFHKKAEISKFYLPLHVYSLNKDNNEESTILYFIAAVCSKQLVFTGK